MAAAFDAETEIVLQAKEGAGYSRGGGGGGGGGGGDAVLASVEGAFEGAPKLLERNNAALSAALRRFGLTVCPAEGGYFLVADVSGVTAMDDASFCRWLIRTVGVACMPMNVFYVDKYSGPAAPICQLVRFCLCKEASVIDAACTALGKATAAELLAASGSASGSSGSGSGSAGK